MMDTMLYSWLKSIVSYIVRADTAAAPVNNHGVISYDIFSTNKWHEKTHFFISDDGYHTLLLTQKYSFVYVFFINKTSLLCFLKDTFY